MSGHSLKRAITSPRRLAAVSTLGALAVFAVASLGTGAGGPRTVRRAPRLPPLLASAPMKRNILLILTESVRFDSVCVDHRAECDFTPFTNRLAPSRYPLLEMRSLSSTTAISVGVLWSGLLPTQMTDAIRTAPMIFDFARAAGYDTAYWSSQNTMFTGSAAFFAALPLTKHCSGADLGAVPDDAGADDSRVTERAKREIAQLREPWLAVVHYANTHYPYRVRGDEPFQPATEDKAAERTAEFKNHYLNAVFTQDRTVADLLGSLRGSAGGARTVVIYTSDHGEAFREHGQLGHTTSVFDEELHVPTWIDAPPEALTPAEREALAAARKAPVWHVDVTPTILDLLGLWDAPAVAAARQRMTGTSLLRSERTGAILPLTNCTEIWGCSFKNWGVVRGSLKLESRELDADWHCWDLARDPHEEHDLGTGSCTELKRAAEGFFVGLPRKAPEMRGLGP